MPEPAPQQPGRSGKLAQRLSLRSRLLLGMLPPLLLLVSLSSWLQYRQARQAADTAYDRTLLASAKSIGETLELAADGEATRVLAKVPYAALETFEADNRSRMYFKVLGLQGEVVAGFASLPAVRRPLPEQQIYVALVHFYNDHHDGQPVRMAVLLQPVYGGGRQGMALVQVAETLELRQTLAHQALLDTLRSHAALLLVVVLVVVVVVQLATRPVREMSAAIEARSDNDLSAVDARHAPTELLPLVQAINRVMGRLDRLLTHQKRFVRDTAHQLRTPLAVLKTQVQSARRGDLPAEQALAEMASTVDRAARLANQMLSLAKVEQLRQEGDNPVNDWAEAVRAVALDLAPLVAERDLEFELQADSTPVRAHDWALRELTRNLLHNAIRHSPRGGVLLVQVQVQLQPHTPWAELRLSDDGPGITETLRQRLFEPFSTGAGGDTGLGLAICHDIVASLGGRIDLLNRLQQGQVCGLEARVQLPLATTRPG